VDGELKIIRQREFHEAVITETTVSAMDASSKEPGFFTLKIRFQDAQTLPPGGTVPAPQRTTRQWLQSAFRLELDPLDCSRVAKIDSFTVKQTFLEADRDLRPGPLSVPNLTVTLAEQGAETWQSWFNDFVLKGNSADDREKHGRLSMLAPDLTKVLAHIDLSNVGIYRLAVEQTEYLPRLVVGLYCERMDFRLG
jgi:hypothetical protein